MIENRPSFISVKSLHIPKISRGLSFLLKIISVTHKTHHSSHLCLLVHLNQYWSTYHIFIISRSFYHTAPALKNSLCADLSQTPQNSFTASHFALYYVPYIYELQLSVPQNSAFQSKTIPSTCT